MTGLDDVVAFELEVFEELRRINAALYNAAGDLPVQDRTRLADELARALALGVKARAMP